MQATKSYFFFFNCKCCHIKALQDDPCYIISWTSLSYFAVSYLVLLARGCVCVGILQGPDLLWGKFKVRVSFTDFPFSSESVTWKKCGELGNVHLPFLGNYLCEIRTVAMVTLRGEGSEWSRASAREFATSCSVFGDLECYFYEGHNYEKLHSHACMHPSIYPYMHA